MALPASDTFLQTSGSPQTLTAYNSNFSLVQGTFNVLSGNGYVNGSSSSTVNLARWNADTFNADQYSQVVFSAASISNGIYIGPACRLQSGAATGYHFDSNGSSNYIVRTVAGSDTTLATPGGTWAAGDVCRMKVEGVGATVTITIEKALAASPTSFSTFATFNDTSGSRITAAGYGGFFQYSDSASGGIVDWEAGNLGGGGATQDLAGGAAGQAAASAAANITKPLAGGATGQGTDTGTLAHTVPLGGGAQGQAGAGGTLLGGATITSVPLKNDSGSLLASVTIEKLAALKVSDLSLAASWTNQGTSGAGVLTLPHAGLVAGTDYLLVTCNSDGSASGTRRYTAA